MEQDSDELDNNEPAIMPGITEKPTHQEKTDRLNLDQEFADIERNLQKEAPRLDKLESWIDKTEGAFKVLQTTTMGRVASLQDEDKQKLASDEWKAWRDTRVERLESIKEKYDQKAGYVPPPKPVQPPSPVDAQKRRIASLVHDITAQTQNLLRDINKESDTAVLSSGTLALYTVKYQAIQKLVRPELADLYDKLYALLEGEQITAAQSAFEKQTQELRGALDGAMAILYKKKFADSSFGQPLATSSPNHSMNVSGGDSASSSSNKGPRYSYPKSTLPVFNGDPLKYPQWRKEYKECILKDVDDAFAVRILTENSPCKDLIALYTTQDECWTHMNDRFANPALVSKQVIRTFNEYTARTLEGPTHQAQVVSLHKLIQKTYLTLKIVGKEKQLTHQISMVTKAQDLLPPRYAEDFTDLLVKEERKLDVPSDGLEPEDHYKLLSDYVKDLANKLETKHPDLLTKKEKRDPPPPRLPGGGRNGRDGKGGESSTKGGFLGLVDTKQEKKGDGKGPRGTSRIGSTVEDAPAHLQDKIKKSFEVIGPCPVCDSPGHVYEGKRGSWGASSSLADCPKYINELTVNQRGELLMQKGWCFKCLSWKHAGKDCKKDKKDWFCHVKENGKVCNKAHSNWLHGCTARLSFLQLDQVPGGQLMVPAGNEEQKLRDLLRRDVMLPIVEFHITDSISTLILLDTGATNSLITNKLAKKLRLKPYKVTQSVTLATKEPEVMTLSYYGVVFELETGPRLAVLLGVDRITSSPGKFSVEPAYREFPHIPRGALDRRPGQVEILLGMDNADLLPGGGLGRDQSGNLRVFSIPFSPGMVLTGHHPEIKFINPVRDESSLAMNSAQFQQVPTFSFNVFDVPSFYEAEMLGYSLPPLCNNCQSCVQCTVRPGYTVRETQELQLMRQNIWHNAEDNTVTVSYPVKPSGKVKPEHFRDNERQAITRAESTMRSLKSRGLLAQYNGCVKDYIDRGVWRKTSREEINAWKAKGNPVHFVAHHGVEKPDSLSTQLRIVVDSSLKNCWSGPRLSELWCKGPNYINELYQILVSWRELEQCGVFDLSKAYHSLKTTDKENFMRLVVWKEESGLDWEIFLHTVVGMGDVPASLFLELAKEIASDLCKAEDTLLAKQIRDLSYVDDGIFGGSQADIDRMRGEYLQQEDGSWAFNGTISRALRRVGFREKMIIVSGEKDPRILAKLGKVLGLQWNATEDTISFKLTINFTEKKGAARVGPDLSDKDLDKIRSMTFTKRLCLQAAAQNFDPLGMIAAFTVRFKLLLKEIVAKEYGWDDPLSSEFQDQWKKLLCEVLCLPELTFPRSITHRLAVARPEIIAYADGSTVAFGSMVYVRYKLAEEAEASYHTAFLTSKSRVTPKHGMTPPRSELQGLIIAVRLVDKIIKAFTTRPQRVTIITDSQCSVAALDVNASSLATFFANRALEISNTMAEWGEQLSDAKVELEPEPDNSLQQSTVTMVDLVQHTPGMENPADWPTRGNLEWSKMDRDTEYQLGPAYLRLERTEWSISRSFVSSIPLEERRKKFMEPLSDVHVNLLHGEMIKSSIKGLHVPADMFRHRNRIYLAPFVFSSVFAETKAGTVLSGVSSVMERTNRWPKARNIVARCIRFWKKKDPAVVRQNPSREEYRQAEWLCQLASMPELIKYLQAKKNLESLAITFVANIAKTRGRLTKDDMNRAMGFDSLTVLPYQARLSYLIAVHAHSQDHRAGGDTLLRIRRLGYWIVSGRRLADKVARDCLLCRIRTARTQEQRMASLPAQISEVPCRAFSHIAIDFAGGMKVKGVVNKRASKICYPLIFQCLNTGCLYLGLAQGYSTEDFLLQFEQFCAIRGTPVLVRADMGSQLVAAGKPGRVTRQNPSKVSGDQEGDLPSFPWDEIKQNATAKAVEFQHCATQAQWRNGRAERAVAALKKTLFHLSKQPKGRDFNYAEVCCMLAKAADVINQRPIGVRHHSKNHTGDFCVITPAMLLQGGRVCSGDLHEQDLCHTMTPYARMALVEETFQHWWKMWFDQVWESLVPVKKWRAVHRNPKVDDIVLLKYSSKFSRPGFRYGVVIETMEDQDNLVRDVIVATRKKKPREKAEEYLPGPMDHQLVPVQRTVLLLPAEDRAGLPEPRDLHICEERLEIPEVSEGDAPLPPSAHGPTAPTSQCAQGPTDPSSQCAPGPTAPSSQWSPPSDDPDATLPLDPEVAQLNHYLSQVVTQTEVDVMEPYTCMDCSVREVVMSHVVMSGQF